MNEMVESVARAIYEQRNGYGCKPWGIQTKTHKAPYLSDAEAAIVAMRQPTEVMISAGLNCDAWAEADGGADVMLAGTYRAMMIAALQDSTPVRVEGEGQ
jgi:hypothetical protein